MQISTLQQYANYLSFCRHFSENSHYVPMFVSNEMKVYWESSFNLIFIDLERISTSRHRFNFIFNGGKDEFFDRDKTQRCAGSLVLMWEPLVITSHYIRAPREIVIGLGNGQIPQTLEARGQQPVPGSQEDPKHEWFTNKISWRNYLYLLLKIIETYLQKDSNFKR